MRKRFVLLLPAALALLSCASGSLKTEPPEKIYKEAVQNYDKNPELAAKLLEQAVSSRVPFVNRQEAMLKLADIYFKMKEYEKAAPEYRAFVQEFPDSPHRQRALFMLGISYFKLIKGPQWDQTFTKKALAAFDEYLIEFPNGKFAKDAQNYRNICRKVLAEHIIYIGGTYDMLKKFHASALRYAEVVGNYTDVEPHDRLLFLYGRALYYTPIHSEQKIKYLRSKIKELKEKLQEAPEADKMAYKNRIKLFENDIKSWEKIGKSSRKLGEKILKELIKKYPKSPFSERASKILEGKEDFSIVGVKNPIKMGFWEKIFKTM